MRRGFPSTDDTTHFDMASRLRFGPCMRHDHDHAADHTDGVPSFFVRTQIRAVRRQRVIEYELRRLEAEAMLPFIDAVLGVVPRPAQWLSFNFITTRS